MNGGDHHRAGLWWLLRPKIRTKVNRAKTDEGRLFKGLLLGFVGFFFWALIFAVIFRMLMYFRGTQGIGDLLAGKLLGLAFLTFLMILVLSNVITALSTFFLSEDLEFVVAAPVEAETVYSARLIETIVDSSWMVALLAIPLLAAYGAVYAAGPLYYLLAIGTVIPFLVIPAVIGSGVTLMLVNVFPARRTRDMLALVGLFAAAGVVVLFRFLRPERLMSPEEFSSLVDFVAVLRTPTSVWLPSEWVAEALLTQLNGRFEWFPLAFLWSTAAMCFVVGAWLHRRYFDAGFTRAQEGAETKDGRPRSRALERAFSNAEPATRAMLAKEFRVFFRDTTQWSQLILLGVLVAVYVYNITVLPLYTGEEVSFLSDQCRLLPESRAGRLRRRCDRSALRVPCHVDRGAHDVAAQVIASRRANDFLVEVSGGHLPVIARRTAVDRRNEHRPRRDSVHPGAHLGHHDRSDIRAHGPRARLRGALPEL